MFYLLNVEYTDTQGKEYKYILSCKEAKKDAVLAEIEEKKAKGFVFSKIEVKEEQ